MPDLAPSETTPDALAAPGVSHSSFICRGCYFIYDEARLSAELGRPAPFADLDDTWSCPDCVTHRVNFRPYRADSSEAPASSSGRPR